jgi:hypothetical protein
MAGGDKLSCGGEDSAGVKSPVEWALVSGPSGRAAGVDSGLTLPCQNCAAGNLKAPADPQDDASALST